MNHDPNCNLSASWFRKSAQTALILAFCCSAANADINVTISQIGPDVKFTVAGSLDISALGNSTSFSGINGFTHTDGGISTTGLSENTTLTSGTVNADLYQLPNDTSMTPIGSLPGGTHNNTFSTGDPMFAIGFADHTPTTPGMGNFLDSIRVPMDYTSGSILSLCFTAPGTTLGMDFDVAEGDFWGTSFADSTGGTQSITFNVVPEPNSFALMIGMACMGLCSRRIRRSRKD